MSMSQREPQDRTPLKDIDSGLRAFWTGCLF